MLTKLAWKLSVPPISFFPLVNLFLILVCYSFMTGAAVGRNLRRLSGSAAVHRADDELSRVPWP